MEALLSLAFDNLSSYDQSKIRKGLRQVDGLLAQVCLSSSNSPKFAAEKRRSVIDPSREPPPRKPLGDCLDRLLGKSHDEQNDLLIIQTLDLIQGIMLLHPPSRTLFSRELYMNVRCPFGIARTIY